MDDWKYLKKTVNGKMEQKQKSKYCFIAYAVLIIVLAVIPLGNSEQLDKTIVIHFRADHLLHAAIFIPWAFFCVKMSHGCSIPSAVRDCSTYKLQFTTFLKSESYNKHLLLWFFGGIFYAAISEGIQFWIPYRSCNVNDMMANIIGVVAGFCIFVSIRKTILSN